MKRHALLIVTIFTVGLTGLVFFAARGAAQPARRAATARHAETARSADLAVNAATRRWLRGEHHHWRDCLLQR